MNRQIYNTQMYLFDNCGCDQKKRFKASIIISVALYLFIFMVHTNPAKKVAHVMPRITCYMHACIHVVLIILIYYKPE